MERRDVVLQTVRQWRDASVLIVGGGINGAGLFRELALQGIDVLLVEVASAEGPYGAKGIGEPPAIPGAAAIANAIEDATGARLTDLPITPAAVLAAIPE